MQVIAQWHNASYCTMSCRYLGFVEQGHDFFSKSGLVYLIVFSLNQQSKHMKRY